MSAVHDDTRHVGVTGTGVGTGVGTGHHGVTGNNNYNNSYDGGHGYGSGDHFGAEPRSTVFLRPMAAPTALGNAAFAGGMWVIASYIAGWWGGNPTIFSLFVLIWGGIAQFIAGIKAFPARDTLATVFHTLWGSFFISVGLYWLLVAASILPSHTFRSDWNDLGSWAVILMIFSYICAYGALARDYVYFGQILLAAFGSTLAVGGWYGSSGTAIKAAAYFWLVSAALATWRTAVYIWEENHGPSAAYPIFRTGRERAAPFHETGAGEPGVKRAMPKWQDRADRAAGLASRSGKASRYSTETGATRV